MCRKAFERLLDDERSDALRTSLRGRLGIHDERRSRRSVGNPAENVRTMHARQTQ